MSNGRSKKRWIIIFGIVAFCCIISIVVPLLFRTYVIQAFKIPSGAMRPTLLIGDHILVNKTPKYKNIIRRGDIIVFPFPEDPRKDFIKRVIGLSGDLIEIRDKEIFVNKEPLTEEYAIFSDTNIFPAEVRSRDNLLPITVPNNSIFVLGDNRDASYDSRFWGFVDLSQVKGKAFKIYWSWDEEHSQVRWDRIGKTLK